MWNYKRVSFSFHCQAITKLMSGYVCNVLLHLHFSEVQTETGQCPQMWLKYFWISISWQGCGSTCIFILSVQSRVISVLPWYVQRTWNQHLLNCDPPSECYMSQINSRLILCQFGIISKATLFTNKRRGTWFSNTIHANYLHTWNRS